MARKNPLPRELRQLDSGRYSLTVEVLEDGKTRRLSGNSILKSEPRSYPDVASALIGLENVRKFLASKADRHTTVKGFWERWINEDDWRWGSEMTGRGRDTYIVYRSRTWRFAERYADRQIATMVEQDVRDAMSAKLMPRSALVTLAMFFRDAAKDGLFYGTNPAGELARLANQTANDRRRTEKRKRKPPKLDAVNAMLARAADPVIPRGFYGWLLTGAKTGMRGGELDGMRFEFLDGDVYDIQQQLHYRSRTLEDPKHESFRKVLLPADVMAEIETARRLSTHDSEYIWLNTEGNAWGEDARSRWWEWSKDGKPNLRQLVGGATMYQATRHSWAWHALNVLKMPVPDIAHLYGHKDGGKTLLEHYADVDNDAALDALRAAYAAQPADLSARRRRAA